MGKVSQSTSFKDFLAGASLIRAVQCLDLGDRAVTRIGARVAILGMLKARPDKT